MTKADIINAMAAQAGLSKSDAEKALNAMTSAMLKAFAAGDSVHLDRIWTLNVVYKGVRAGRNPRTGEAIIIPASKTVKLTPSKFLKEAVNG